MKKTDFLVIILFSTLFTNCATSLHHPTKGDQGFSADQAICSAQAERESNKAYDSMSSSSIVSRVYGICMRGKGWVTKYKPANHER